MKNISSKSYVSGSKKLITTLGIIFLLLLISGVTLFVLEKTRVTNFVKDPFYVTEQEKSEEATKSDPTTNLKNSSEDVDGVDPNKPTDQIPTSLTISIAIDQIQQTAETVTVTTNIRNSATKGVCSYTFSKEGARPVVRSITTSTSTCKASIPSQEFEMIGTWSLVVSYFGNDTQASTTGTIDVQ
jgi:hypothetical protein